MVSKKQIYHWLEDLKDPEIPVLSLVDLGIITNVDVSGDQLKIEMTPTFVGCPALDYMKEDVEVLLKRKGIKSFRVEVNYKKPWSSDLISEKGKVALKKYGFAPPSSAHVFADLGILEEASCPRCNSTNTQLKNPFGSTLCRSIYYCNDCKEAFEQFKAV